MIEIVTGVPGAGKSSYAITRLVKTFAKDEKLKKKISNSLKIPDVKKAVTNINELKLKKFKNVSSFKFDDLLIQLRDLEKKARLDNWNDKQLVELAKEYNMYETMFIIDEFHNYFDKQDKALVWWLSYHRHLHQHIILMTQNLSLVNAKYKSFSEYFLKAVPGSLKIFSNNIILKKYIDSRMSKTSFTGTIKIKKFNEIFEMYGSGANHKSKSAALPYLFLAFFALVLVFVYFRYFVFTTKPVSVSKKENLKEKNNNKRLSYANKKPKKIYDGKKFISVFCSKEDCYYHDNIFSRALIDDKTSGIDIISRKYFTNIMQYNILIPESLYYLFDNEKSNLLVVTKDSTVSSVVK